MTSRMIFTLLIYCFGFECFSMDVISPWSSLPIELKSKIVACCDTVNRKKWLCINRELSHITAYNLALHSPLYLTRREHISCLIQSAQNEQKKVVKNLIKNAALCDHADVLDWLPLFKDLSRTGSESFLDQKLSRNTCGWIFRKCEENERLAGSIQKRRDVYCDSFQQNWKLICGFFRGDQRVMNEYICKACYISDAVEITTRKLNPLLAAVLINDVSMVELVTMRNPELIDVADANGCMPLYLTEDVNIAQLLLSCKGIDVNKGEETNGTTPLQKFAFSGNVDLVRLVLKHPDCKIDTKKSTPLHTAVSQGYNDIVEKLLEHDDTLLDVQDEQGYTALMCAVENELAGTTQLLLRHEPDCLLRNNDENAARDLVPNQQIRQILFMHEVNSLPVW